MSSGTNGEERRRPVYSMVCMNPIQPTLHQLSHKHPRVLSFSLLKEIILFHMIGHLTLFIKWNFNWKEMKKEIETHRRLQSKLWQQEFSIFVSLFNFWISHIAWILLGIYAPCYSGNRTSITNSYLACLSVSCRWVISARQIEMWCYRFKSPQQRRNCLNSSILWLATTGKTMKDNTKATTSQMTAEICASLITPP